ncbi:MAG: hypothetical protein U0271_05840 [Polyangiaceae bacterium]
MSATGKYTVWAWVMGSAFMASACAANNTASESSKPAKAEPASSAATTDADSVALKKHYPQVGDVERSRKVIVTKLHGAPKDKKPVDLERGIARERADECLKIVDRECVTLKVTYRVLTKRDLVKGKATDQALASQGKTYFVDRSGAKPGVTLEDGSSPSEAEISQVRKDFSKAPSTAKLLDALPDSLKVGDSLDAFAKAYAAHDLGAGDDHWASVDYSVKVKAFGEVDGKKTVILEVVGELDSGALDWGQMKMKGTGMLEVFVDSGAPARGSFSGPVTLALPNGEGQLDGTLEHNEVSSYSFVGG